MTTEIVTKLKNSNYDNSNCDKTQKLKLSQNLKYDKYQFMRGKKT